MKKWTKEASEMENSILEKEKDIINVVESEIESIKEGFSEREKESEDAKIPKQEEIPVENPNLISLENQIKAISNKIKTQ